VDEPPQRLSTNVARFCTFLREEYGFAVGRMEARDALRALEIVGVADRARVCTALRLVCCSTPAEVGAFDRAFDAFFSPGPLGLEQPDFRPRHTRPDIARSSDRVETPAHDGEHKEGEDAGVPAGALQRRLTDDDDTDAPLVPSWLRARYSALASSSDETLLTNEIGAGLVHAANRLISGVHLGHSRHWRAMSHGERFDVRRTMRSSLQTGGEPINLRFRGHPRRNPRFLLLIDGSRSVADEAGTMLQFARALCACSRRVNVFVFSTELREVTREIRATLTRGGTLSGLGEAWGGGTRIGASLAALIERDGARVLTPETVVLIFSDGLDVGEPDRLARAMRELDRRSAGVVWINPHAGTGGYAPAARGMRAALPYVIALSGARDAHGFEAMAEHVARSARIRGHRT
jgi:uncharacterized protein